MHEQQRKKMVAPIIITVIFVVLFVAYAVMYFTFDELPLIIKLGFGGILIALAIAMVHVLVTRIREIKGGEEDDLSNY